jgi:hypothetical protein
MKGKVTPNAFCARPSELHARGVLEFYNAQSAKITRGAAGFSKASDFSGYAHFAMNIAGTMLAFSRRCSFQRAEQRTKR